ncbi:MAG: glycosyl hydrolase family 65 protein [Christensenellaceae bacterium]
MLHEGWKSYAFKINYHGCVLSVKGRTGKDVL